jgi:hypothetical protein
VCIIVRSLNVMGLTGIDGGPAGNVRMRLRQFRPDQSAGKSVFSGQCDAEWNAQSQFLIERDQHHRFHP